MFCAKLIVVDKGQSNTSNSAFSFATSHETLGTCNLNHLSHASLGEGREFGSRFEFLRRSKNQSENLATDFALSCKGFQSCSNPSGIAKVGRLDSLSGFTKGTYPSLQGIKFRGFSDFQLRGF